MLKSLRAAARGPIRPTHAGGRLLAVAVLAAGIGAVAFTAPAGATTPPDCKTVTSTLSAHPDNGHGTGGSPSGHWADVSGTRTVKVCVVDVPVLTEKSLTVQDATFKATVLDDGTFVTFAGDHLSPAQGNKLAGGVNGSWHGGFDAVFKAPKPTAPGDWPNWTPATVSGKTFVGTNGPSTGNWVKALWTGVNFGEQQVDWTAHYSWTYKICNERWVDAYNNKDGTTPQAGDITGLSKKPCYGNPSFTSNCDGTVTVLLINAAPSNDSNASYRVSGVEANHGVVLVPGGKPGQVSVIAMVDANGHVFVVWSVDRHLFHKSYTYVKPKTCTTPTPTPTTSTPTVPGVPTTQPGLPVTGANVTASAIGGGVLLLAGIGLVLVLRRRRIRFEA